MAPLLSLSLSLLPLLLASPAHALWPLPRTLQTGPSTAALRLSPSFHITLSLPHNATAPQDLLDAAARAKGYLTTDALGRLVVGRGASDAAAVARAPAHRGGAGNDAGRASTHGGTDTGTPIAGRQAMTGPTPRRESVDRVDPQRGPLRGRSGRHCDGHVFDAIPDPGPGTRGKRTSRRPEATTAGRHNRGGTSGTRGQAAGPGPGKRRSSTCPSHAPTRKRSVGVNPARS